jgi:hypothetical protein
MADVCQNSVAVTIGHIHTGLVICLRLNAISTRQWLSIVTSNSLIVSHSPFWWLRGLRHLPKFYLSCSPSHLHLGGEWLYFNVGWSSTKCGNSEPEKNLLRRWTRPCPLLRRWQWTSSPFIDLSLFPSYKLPHIGDFHCCFWFPEG